MAFTERHIGFTATCSYLRISRHDRDNQVFVGKPTAYTLAPLGFIGVLVLDVVLLPITSIHDAIMSFRSVDPDDEPSGTYKHRYRRTIHGLILSQ